VNKRLNKYSFFDTVTHQYYPRNTFDVAFCLEVFDYVYDPITAMKNIAWFLKKGGIAYITYNLMYPDHNPAGMDCLRYTKNAIEKYLELSGMHLLEGKERTAKDVGCWDEWMKSEGFHAIGERAHDQGYMIKSEKI